MGENKSIGPPPYKVIWTIYILVAIVSVMLIIPPLVMGKLDSALKIVEFLVQTAVVFGIICVSFLLPLNVIISSIKDKKTDTNTTVYIILFVIIMNIGIMWFFDGPRGFKEFLEQINFRE